MEKYCLAGEVRLGLELWLLQMQCATWPPLVIGV